MSPGVFALAHLGLLLGLLVWLAFTVRQARTDAWSNRRTRYRRLSTEDLLKELRKPPT